MTTAPIAIQIQPALERGEIEDVEIDQMRREWREGATLKPADADALFALQGMLAGRNSGFNSFFWDALTAYILEGGELKGSISNSQGTWVMAMLDGGEGLVANTAELELLVRLIEDADQVPSALASFALHQIEHSAITGEGPAARGRIHFSRVIDAKDVATLARLLQVARGDRRRIISRDEAEILFNMAEACTTANDPGWNNLFAQAIQAHLVASNQSHGGEGASLATPVVLDDRDSAWLRRRIQHDGQVSGAERALLQLVEPRQMAGGGAWSRSIGQML